MAAKVDWHLRIPYKRELERRAGFYTHCIVVCGLNELLPHFRVAFVGIDEFQFFLRQTESGLLFLWRLTRFCCGTFLFCWRRWRIRPSVCEFRNKDRNTWRCCWFLLSMLFGAEARECAHHLYHVSSFPFPCPSLSRSHWLSLLLSWLVLLEIPQGTVRTTAKTKNIQQDTRFSNSENSWKISQGKCPGTNFW